MVIFHKNKGHVLSDQMGCYTCTILCGAHCKKLDNKTILFLNRGHVTNSMLWVCNSEER